MTNNILLATFCYPSEVMSFCRKIWNMFPDNESVNKIFLLKVKDENYTKKIITYNLVLNDGQTINYKTIFPQTNTVHVHRKKDTNTIYTINAINAIQLNVNGRVDPNYEIDWNSYKNSFLLERDDELIILQTELERIFHRGNEGKGY